MKNSALMMAAIVMSMAPVVVDAQRVERPRPGDVREGCIGGERCRDRARIVIRLENRPVTAVSFTAHDGIGDRTDGKLLVRIDDEVIERRLDISRRPQRHDLLVRSVSGRELVIEPATDDEVEITDVQIRYGTVSNMRPPERPGRFERGSRTTWTPYPRDAQCIGGVECRGNGNRILVRLENAPILAVRFHAHDAVGRKAEGALNVRLDDEAIAWQEDVPRDGRRFLYETEGITARVLTIEAASDDEVQVSEIEVLYDTSRSWWSERDDDDVPTEGCIGGANCGGSRAAIRIALSRRPVREITFRAHDDIGSKRDGSLRVRIDDRVVASVTDVPNSGKRFRFSIDGIIGRELIIEPASNDEVVVEDIDVRYR